MITFGVFWQGWYQANITRKSCWVTNCNYKKLPKISQNGSKTPKIPDQKLRLVSLLQFIESIKKVVYITIKNSINRSIDSIWQILLSLFMSLLMKWLCYKMDKKPSQFRQNTSKKCFSPKLTYFSKTVIFLRNCMIWFKSNKLIKFAKNSPKKPKWQKTPKTQDLVKIKKIIYLASDHADRWLMT